MALTDKLNAIGDAIREKNGTTDLIPLVDMPRAILDLSSDDGEKTYVEVIPTATITLVQKNEEWVEGTTSFFEQLQEIDTNKNYKLTIDENVYYVSMSKVLENYGYTDCYGCGNIEILSGNDTYEDYFFNVRPGVLHLLLRNSTVGTHTIKLEEVDNAKEEQEKTVDITENGTTEVIPDENKVLSKVTVNVDVAGGGSVSIDENGIVTFGGNTSIDESGIVSL